MRSGEQKTIYYRGTWVRKKVFNSLIPVLGFQVLRPIMTGQIRCIRTFHL